MKWLVLLALCLAITSCAARRLTQDREVISLDTTSLSPEARAVSSALAAYCQEHGLELKQVLAGLRSVLHLAANERIGLYPANRNGSGESEHEGQVFATDELAVESIHLRPAKPGSFSSDNIATDRILVATAHPTDPQLHIPLDLALALAGGGGIEEGQRISLPFVESAPSVFANALSDKNIYLRAGQLCGLEPKQLAQALRVALEKEWPSSVASLLELIDAAGFADKPRTLGSFDFGALVSRRKLDALPAAPEALSSRLRRFGLTHARRLFNKDGPEVYRVVVASKDAFKVWRDLSEAASELGYFPVVLGGDHEVEDLDEHWTTRREQNESRPREEHYLNLKPGEEASWIGLRQDRFVSNTPQEVLGHLGRLDPIKLLNGQDSPYKDLKPPHGDWPASPMKASGQSKLVVGDWTHIALVPARQPWEVPAFLPFFSGEGYPDQAELVAVARYYHERYGARVFGMNSGAEVELWVPRSLSSKEEALAVATEHYFFCPDGNEDTVETQAARLMQTPFWWFWWD